MRAAQEFEALRDAADAADRRPSVYLATIGPIARHTARAAFAANLFQAGGLATPSGDGASGLADAGTSVACICGTDADYAEARRPWPSELRAAGATQVWLAGKPYAGGGRRRRVPVRRLRRARRPRTGFTSSLGVQR